ncbi:NADH-quinone oxidoreductase subunit I [Cutibacterium avidum ATCC 25577]|uniref:NADH-quinone oxidoreductase subunit I n=1 Tax=Cutibacterium avidum ATCC 25577 TaxID=997355 RepID=G4CVC7_9ACTN|nr:NADH-quinone oxidoreductase subunit I [Cutibacterium avidum ATCC 25577]
MAGLDLKGQERDALQPRSEQLVQSVTDEPARQIGMTTLSGPRELNGVQY